MDCARAFDAASENQTTTKIGNARNQRHFNMGAS
jgi:hypothetical protein